MLCDEIIRARRSGGEMGIGTLSEKRMHAMLKRYVCPNEDFHEVGVEGTRYVSDVRIGNEIYEIQTGSFYPMKKKIAYYLEHTDCNVTVVHPIPAVRWMSWVEPETMEIHPRRKVAGKKATLLLPELYYLSEHLGNPRLRFRVLLLEVHDFRLLNGWSGDRKKGSDRYERIPLSLIDEIDLNTPDDFQTFLPDTLPAHFTVKQFSTQTKLRGRNAYSAVRALAALGIVEAAEPIGRSMGWKKTKHKTDGSVQGDPSAKEAT